jgi:hypothetical protein
MIGPQRLRYLFNIVICPALAYQFLIAPCSLPLLKRLSSAISSAVKKHLYLPKDIFVLFIFSDCAFGAEEMESVFLAKALSDFYVALQKDSRNSKIANAYLAQLNCQMWDQNSAFDNPIQINGSGFHHPLSQTRSLMAPYGLSLCNDNKSLLIRISSALEAPIKNSELKTLSQSLL